MTFGKVQTDLLELKFPDDSPVDGSVEYISDGYRSVVRPVFRKVTPNVRSIVKLSIHFYGELKVNSRTQFCS